MSRLNVTVRSASRLNVVVRKSQPIILDIVKTGSPGVGVPPGGLAGQVLAKFSEENYATHWIDVATGGAVDSVNGKIGAVVLEAADVGADPAGSAAQALNAANDYTDQQISNIDVGVTSVNTQTGDVELTTDDIEDTPSNRYTNDTDIQRLENTSGTNTGDQDLSGLVPNTRTINGQTLESDVDLDANDVGAEPAFTKGDLIAGTNVTLDGTLSDRLVGSGDVTINATGGGDNPFITMGDDGIISFLMESPDNGSLWYAHISAAGAWVITPLAVDEYYYLKPSADDRFIDGAGNFIVWQAGVAPDDTHGRLISELDLIAVPTVTDDAFMIQQDGDTVVKKINRDTLAAYLNL